MDHKLVVTMFLAFVAPLTAGCVLADETAASDTSDLSASSRSWVTLTKDTRKCLSPVCGGYWVKDVNRKTAAQYVSDLDFSISDLDEDAIEQVRSAPPGELVIRGKLGKKETQFNTRKFLVSEAYRGMPGVVPVAGETFYNAKDRSPVISCFAAPCPNEAATKLNSTQKTYFDGYSAERALQPHVDEAWLIEQIEHHDAVVAAVFSDGQPHPGGAEKVLDASQVYVKVPANRRSCPAFKLAACPEGQVWTYTRDENLCQHPDKCVEDGNCPSLQPPHCADGYDIASWRVDSPACRTFSCDPSFVMTPWP